MQHTQAVALETKFKHQKPLPETKGQNPKDTHQDSRHEPQPEVPLPKT